MAFGKEMEMMGGKPKLGAKGSTAQSSKPKPKDAEPKGEEGEPKDGDSGEGMSLHANGDGSYKTSDGEEHDHLGKALMHMAHHHEPDGKHMHIKHDGLSAKSHGVHEDGTHDGPKEGDTEEAKAHMDSMFGDEQPDETGDGEQKPEPMMGGYGG